MDGVQSSGGSVRRLPPQDAEACGGCTVQVNGTSSVRLAP
jgi:hypothetical protein